MKECVDILGYNSGRSVTLVVAAVDATKRVREGADYECTGTADDIRI